MKKKIILVKLRFLLWSLALLSFFCTESSFAQLTTKSTVTSSNGAEISAFDPTTNRVFTVAGNAIEYYTLNSAGVLSSPTAIPYGFTVATGATAIPNSVAVKNGVLAFGFAIVGANNAQQFGKLAFYNPATATYISDVTVGYLPDMIAFSPDSTKILTANEGEPNSYSQSTSFDPEGSVSIVDISAGITNASVTEASFTSFNSQMASLKAAGVRIYGPNATVAQDLEPEYVTFVDNTTAVVTLQENNAVAVVNIATGTVTNIYPLGLKDHSIAGNGFDASDRDLTSSTGKINIQNWPVKGMYMPDAIASFTSGGSTYFITANEGDSRAYTGYSEEIRVGASSGYTLDPTVFPNATTLKLNANLGRLQLSNASGDTDGDGDFDEIHALGARSFTIWNNNFTKVFDSGDQLEQITATQSATSFNSDGTSASFDSRSDNKGPEPEGVTTGTVNGTPYAFLGSERTGDIFVYDITNPTAPVFKQYLNTAADTGVEGIIFVSGSESPTGNALVITSAEVSKTVSVYEFTPPTVNLSVSTNTASETVGTVVTVTATASAPVDGIKTLTLNVSGTNIIAADYALSNATITIPSGSTTGSVTFTVLNDNAVEALESAVLTISNPSSGIALGTTTTQNIAISDYVFTLQILHASDFEAAVDAVQDAPRFAAIVDVLEDTYANTIKLSSGDNYIPGPFLSSGEDSSLSAALKTSYESYYNTTFSSSAVNLLPSIGRADISILNFIGIEASALGNHEFDLGTTEVKNIIRGANSSAVRTWFGAQFPYLSSDLNFSGDSNLSAIATTDRLRLNTSFMSTPSETTTAITNKLKLAPSTIIMKGGQKIGIVGATTQVLASISSPGSTTVVGGGANDMTILAGIIQPVVNSLIADGCNKIILLSHLQQIAFEKELAGKLTGVDIIVAGGSHELMADSNDRLRAGDMAAESYPFLTTNQDGKALALINTDGNYKYVGRLVVDFDADGTLIPSSINSQISGAYAADAQGLNDAWGANVANAYAVGTRGYQVKLLCDVIGNVINVKDGNLFGKTTVFLEGRRNFVRTEETNLGNVSAEANLWLAKFYDPSTVISIKNGGGIRSAIGNVLAVGDNVTYAPPIANPSANKQTGDISQLDIENSLRFNNKLSLVTLTASGLRSVLEHAVKATTATATPGQFAQVAGVRYSYDFNLAAGSRILNAVVTDVNGNIIDTLVVNGVTQGDLTRTFRVVTLNFLAGGGDSYPFNTLGTSRSDLDTVPELGPAMASFTTAGSEQDAFAEYMKNQYNTNPYGITDTPLTQDCRIQRVPARADNVLPPSAGANGTLVICNATTVTQAQLFAALGGTPATGGTWSPVLAGAGIYTYTVTSPSCAGSASATVTVTVTDALVASSASQGTVDCNSTTATVVVTTTGGTAPYTGTGTFTVGAGSYSYTITDAKGCTAVTTGTVTNIADTTNPTIYLQPSALLTGATGPSTTQTPYLQSQSIGGKYTSILSVNDAVGGYKMVGIPDGLGAYDNNNGTFTLLMNHELGNTAGIARAHGSAGAFVSKWVINKSDLVVQSGSDLIQTVNTWNTTSNSFVTGTTAFNRFCSADLPSVPALYNAASGLGTKERIFLTGEESGAEGRAFGHIATGATAGVTYELPYLGKFSWENVVASPATGNKTVVAGTDDNSTNGQVYFYVGTKTNTGTEIDKAGLNNGKLFGVNVTGLASESSSSIPAANTAFTLSDLGFVQNKTGATLNTESLTAGVTNFLRPEDGGFDPSNPNDFYFVTTNSMTAPSRMWRLRFNDIANPETGGTVTAVLDGTEGQKMLDNMTIDKLGHILLQEDPGGNAHNAKMWQYTIATDALELVGKHDAARFGEVVGTTTTPAILPYTNDEESSGVIDMSDILGPGMFLIDDQAHYTTDLANLTEVVQGGQLLAFFNPASVSATVSNAAQAVISVTSCSATAVVLGTPATADNCSIVSLTNNAPTTFPVGTTTVTWTATDASGNSATATQTVIVTVPPQTLWYADTDGDGYGDSNVTTNACSQPTGYVINNTDCAPTDPTRNASFPFYADADADGFGAGNAVTLCAVNATTPPTGYSVSNTDCDDTNAAIKPSATEIFDTIDNDCDGLIDEGTTLAAPGVTNLTVCVGSPSVTLTATALPGYTLRWYAAASGGTALTATPVVATTAAIVKSFWVSQKLGTGTESARVQITVTVVALPATPGTITGTAAICVSVGTINELTYSVATVTGASSYQWTVPTGATIVSGQGTNTVSVNFANVSAGITPALTIGVRSENATGCLSLAKTLALTRVLPTAPAALVMTNSTSATPTTAIAAVGPFIGTSTELTLTATASATATSYIWTLPTGVNQLSGGNTNVITVNFAGVGTGITALPISVQSTNGCGNSILKTLSLTRALPAKPAAIATTNTNVCVVAGSSSTVTYTVASVVGAFANGYAWTVPTGATIVSGQGTVAIVVSYTTSFVAAGSVTVTSSNGVGTSATAAILAVAATAPAVPATLVMTLAPSTTAIAAAGPYMATSTELTLTAAQVTGAASYAWTLPAGVNQVSGGTGRIITVNFASVATPTGITALVISVKAVNGCGLQSVAKALSLTRALPAKPAAVITSLANVCAIAGTSNTVTYSVVAVSGAFANGYAWTVPTGGTIVSGQGTTSIAVSYAGSFTAGNVSVTSSNGVGTSLPTTLAVARTSGAVTPATIVGQVAGLCAGTPYSYTFVAGANAQTHTITGPVGSVVTSADNSSNTTNTITTSNTAFTVVYPTSAIVNISIVATNPCGSSAAKTYVVSKAMGAITAISGSTAVDTCSEYTYTASAVVGAVAYTWTIPSGAQIVSGQGTNTLVVVFPGTLATGAVLKVLATNACSVSSALKSSTVLTRTTCPAARSEVVLQEVTKAPFSVKAYPNPYSENFNLSVTTSSEDKVGIVVYDMTGRLIERRDVRPSDMVEQQIGDRYPSGVYNVVITQGQEVKTLRVIKK